MKLLCVAAAVLMLGGCALPPPVPEPKEPTDNVIIVRVTTSPEPELIEPILTAYEGPEMTPLYSDDVPPVPLTFYKVAPPIVSPWGYEFRQNLENTGQSLSMSVRVKAGRKVKVTCNWYVGTSVVPIHVDHGVGETVCMFVTSFPKVGR